MSEEEELQSRSSNHKIGLDERSHIQMTRRHDLLLRIAGYAPKAVKRELKQIVDHRWWADFDELSLIQKAQRFQQATFFLGDTYIYTDHGSCELNLFGKFHDDYDTGRRCNEIIGPHFALDDKSLRRLFTKIELVVRIAISIVRGSELSRYELESQRRRALLVEATIKLKIPEALDGLHRLFDVRAQFAHSPLPCEKLTFCDVPLGQSFSKNRLLKYERDGIINFIDQAFCVTDSLIGAFRRIQHDQLDFRALRDEVLS